jgi:hypothetical protein
MRILLSSIILLVIGCTDAKRSQLFSYGDPAEIICYSGGQVIYKGHSSGKVLTEEQSDGWFFKDAETGQLIRVSGDCVIRN